MKKIYFFLLAMIVSFAAQAWTVAFTNPDNWSKVYIYAWTEGGTKLTGDWPGTEMTLRDGVYVYTGEGDAANVIFNNNSGSQTGDLTFTDNGTYAGNDLISTDPIAPLEPEEEDPEPDPEPDPIDPETQIIVYFENTENWSNVYAYNWQSTNTSNTNHGWPGVSINANTKEFPVKDSDETKTLYYYIVTNELWNAIIFNSGNGQSQTGDLKVVNGAVYSGTANLKGTQNIQAVGNIVDEEYVPADYVEPTMAKIYFPCETYTANKAYFYTWGPQITSDWPGTELEKESVDGTDCWVFSVNNEVIDGVTVDGIQLNNGSGNEVELKNIVLKDGDVIDIQTGVIGNVEDGFNLGEYNPEAPVYYLVGTIFENNVSGGDIRQVLTDETATEDYWTWTGEVVPGIFYILKVENGVETKYYASNEPHITGKGVFDCVVAGDDAATEAFNLNAQGTYKFTFNPDAMTLTAVVEGDVEPVNYVLWEVEIRGTFNNWGENIKHPNTKGIVTFKDVKIGNGEFKIVLRNRTSPQEWLSTGGAVPVGAEVILYHEDANMTVENATAESKYDVTIDVAHNRMTVATPTTGIEEIINNAVESVDENAPVEYFNLQGVRIENPTNGLYIRRQGNKATKVLVK